jgi:hypothetical protein
VGATAELDSAFARYCVVIRFDADTMLAPAKQVALLTLLNLAARTFDGQVQLDGPSECMFSIQGFEGQTVADAAASFGAHPAYCCPGGTPVVALRDDGHAIRPVAQGWRAAAVGIGSASPLEWDTAQPLAAVAAAALAMNEVFHILRDDHPLGGRRVVGLSLWRPEVIEGWGNAGLDGPRAVALAHPILVLGLGHLGQAYLWALAMQLQGRQKPALWLQDDDKVTGSTWSTSMLTPRVGLRQRKTRVVAAALEAWGFDTCLVEQRLLNEGQVTAQTPRLILHGVDNLDTRRLIAKLPLVALVEAGLGDTYDTFRSIRIHSFPSEQNPERIWAPRPARERELAPAYKDMLTKTNDQCGITTLASRAVGVPFVGCFAACLVVSELLRRMVGADALALQDLNLSNVENRECLRLTDLQ